MESELVFKGALRRYGKFISGLYNKPPMKASPMTDLQNERTGPWLNLAAYLQDFSVISFISTPDDVAGHFERAEIFIG